MVATERRFPHISANGGTTYRIIGELITCKLSSAETGDTFSVMEGVSQPGGGPPLHTHPAAELFVIQEGMFAFTGVMDGERYTIRATPGEMVYIPGGAPHTYTSVGPTAGKALIILSPGGAMEHFFAEVGAPVTDRSAPVNPVGPPSAAEIAHHMAIAERYGIVFLPPDGANTGRSDATGRRHG
jgi:quercetin dioxygenase-like cupin family protein